LKTSGVRAIAYLAGILVVLAAVAVTFTVIRPIGPSIREGLDLKGGVRVVLRTVHPASAAGPGLRGHPLPAVPGVAAGPPPL